MMCVTLRETLSKTLSAEKGRKAKERDDPASLRQFLRDLGDLLAKEFCAAGGRMADAVCVHVKFFELCGGDFSQRDDLIARKQFEKSIEHRQAGSSLGLVRHTIAQHAAARIE